MIPSQQNWFNNILGDDADPGLTHRGMNIIAEKTNYGEIEIPVALSDFADFC